MNHIKLFEDFDNNVYCIGYVVLSKKFDKIFIYFLINNMEFKVDISNAKLIYNFFIDTNSPMLDYIKSDKFVDDLQVRLFDVDIMDYSAEEVQWIIKKDCEVVDKDLVYFLKTNLNNLNEYQSASKKNQIFYGQNPNDPIFYYDKHNSRFYIIPRSSFTDLLYRKFKLTVENIMKYIVPYICETYNINYNYVYQD